MRASSGFRGICSALRACAIPRPLDPLKSLEAKKQTCASSERSARRTSSKASSQSASKRVKGAAALRAVERGHTPTPRRRTHGPPRVNTKPPQNPLKPAQPPRFTRIRPANTRPPSEYSTAPATTGESPRIQAKMYSRIRRVSAPNTPCIRFVFAPIAFVEPVLRYIKRKGSEYKTHTGRSVPYSGNDRRKAWQKMTTRPLRFV